MQPLKNNRLLKTIAREPVDCTPIWLMRQAGRYLPEYRAIRARAGSFMALCQTPELACEVTLQPLARYALDAAIIFSDILTIPDAMGLGLSMIEGKGPCFQSPLQTRQAIQQLAVPDPLALAYVYEAIALTQRELAGRVPLIGFCGSPWTLAAYMVEGCATPGFPKIMQLRQEDPAMLHHLLTILAESVALHLNMQIEAGVQVAMLFDTWGGLLTTPDYHAFSLHYLQQVMKMLRAPNVPVILFTKQGNAWLTDMAASGCDVVGVDWTVSLKTARAQMGERVAVQGNLHPAILLQSPETIREHVAMSLADFGHGSGHIFNLGHGITPDVPPEHVQVLVEAVHELSRVYHSCEI